MSQCSNCNVQYLPKIVPERLIGPKFEVEKSLGSLWAIINALSVGSDVFSPFFFHPTEFLRGLNDGNPWKLLIFIFQMSANLSFTASKIIRHLVFQYSIDNEINLDNCVLVSCLLMSSVKKNNFLACSLNFSLILACCSVDYLSQTVHFCLHHNLLYAIYYSIFRPRPHEDDCKRKR